MVEDVTKGPDAVGLPVTVVVGDRDQVEHEDTLTEVFARFLPQATFRRLRGVGHLSPLEAPDALADACNALLHELRCRLRRIASEPEPVARLGYALRGFNDYSPALGWSESRAKQR